MVIITIKRILSKQNEFYIIPSHPLDKDTPEIFAYDEGFNKIQWDILDGKVDRDYNNREIRMACMAECVMEYTIPSSTFSYIYVYDENAKTKIDSMEKNNPININVAPYMFP